MKLRTKLFSTILMFSLTIVTLMVGVWAVKSASVSMGGTLSFIAPGVEATISAGTMTNGEWQNSADADTKLQEVQITKTDTESTLTTKFASWQDINLNFKETGDDITITFSITNNSSSTAIDISVSASYASATNCTIAINTSSVSLDAGDSQSFTLTMKITDKDLNASMTNFAVVFNMQMVDPPTPAEDVSYLTFSYDDTTMTASVTDCDTSVTSVEIPSRLLYNGNTYDVTSIYDGAYNTGAFYQCTSLASITIPDSVTSIGNNAFRGCTGLTEITIPGSVTSMGQYAFYNCTGLTSVTIGNGVTSIGDSAFYGCSELISLDIPDSIISVGTRALFNCSSLSYNSYESGNYLGNANNPYTVCVEYTDASSTSCIINENCKIIYYNAFNGCTGLTELTIPASVTSIGDSAFSGCNGVTSISIDSGNMTYDSRDNCNAIIETATNTLIQGCQNTVIPNTVTKIAGYSFAWFSQPTSIIIPNSVISIGERAFYNCTELTNVTIGDNVVSIGYDAFSGCTSLTSITIPDSVTSIGYQAFYSCKGLTSITIPAAVTEIGYYAFYNCASLTSVTIKAIEVPTAGISLFKLCNALTKIYVPSTSVDLYKAATNWSEYSTYMEGKTF